MSGVNDLLRLVIAGPVSVDDEQSGEGSGVTWANDLVTSTDTHQWVSGISGQNGTGATCVLRAGVSIIQTAASDHVVSEYPLQIQPFDATRATYQIRYRGVLFNTTTDPVTYIGWNTDRVKTAQAIGYMVIEADFESAPGVHQLEHYFETAPTGNSDSAHTYRPLGYVMNITTGALTTFVQYAGASFVGIGGPAGGPTAQQFAFVDGELIFNPTNYVVRGTDTLTITTGAGDLFLQPGGVGQGGIIAHNVFLQSTTAGIELLAAAGQTLTLSADNGAFHKADESPEMVWDYAGGQFRLYPVADNLGALGVGPVNRLSKVATHGLSGAQATQTANYTIDQAGANDCEVGVNTAAIGAFAVTLPDPATNLGRKFSIVDWGNHLTAANVTLTRHGAETINGVAGNLALALSGARYEISCDGTNWWVTVSTKA